MRRENEKHCIRIHSDSDGTPFVSCLFQGAPRISKEELRTMLGDPNVIIVDVRIDDEWRASEKKIQGANWKNPEEFGSWLKQYPKDKTLVFYCS